MSEGYIDHDIESPRCPIVTLAWWRAQHDSVSEIATRLSVLFARLGHEHGGRLVAPYRGCGKCRICSSESGGLFRDA